MSDGRTLKYHGYGKIKLGLEQSRPMIVKVLIADGWLLGFDLPLEIDAIEELGGMHLIESVKHVLETQTSVLLSLLTSPSSV